MSDIEELSLPPVDPTVLVRKIAARPITGKWTEQIASHPQADEVIAMCRGHPDKFVRRLADVAQEKLSALALQKQTDYGRF